MQYVPFYNEPNPPIAHAAGEVMHYFWHEHPLHTGMTVVVFGVAVGVQLTDTGLWFGQAWDDDFVKNVALSQTAGNWELMAAQCCDVFTYLAIQAGHVNLAA